MSTNLSSNYSQFNFAMAKPCKKVVYEFETFRLDAAQLLLFRNGQEIPLAPKVVETLLVLVENAGEVVGKDELMREIWADLTVEESNLSQNLFRLRKVLGETKSGKPFIETLRRRGYRFAPDVEIVKVAAIATETAPNLAPSDQSGENSEEQKNAAMTATGDFSPDIEISPELPFTAFRASSENGDGFAKNGSENIFVATSWRSTRKSRRAVLAALGTLIVTASLGLVLRFRFEPQPAVNFRETNLKLLTENGNLAGASISPDGNTLAYITREGKNFSLRLRNISNDSEVAVIAPSEKAMNSPRFSPDGNFIFYEASEGIFQLPIFGGDARLVAADLRGAYSVSPDGRQVIFPRSKNPDDSPSIVIAEIGGGERTIPPLAEPDFFVNFGPSPILSPSGKRLTVVAGRRDSKEMRLVEIDLQTGAKHEMPTQDTWENIGLIAWEKPDETLLVCAQRKGEAVSQIWSVEFPEGIARRVTNDFNDYLGFSLSRDTGNLVAVREMENVHLWLFDRENGAARQITSGTNLSEGRFGLALAPDAKRIVYTARDKNSYNIFSISTNNANDVRQLTKNVGRLNLDPAFSPDGGTIAFVSDRTGAPRLWLMNADGSDARQLTPASSETENTENSPYFSPDGRWIYYVFYQSGKGSIRKIPVDGGESLPVTQTNRNIYEPVVSPDGKWMAHAIYNDEATKPWQIGVMSLDDSATGERFFNFPAFRLRPRWSPDSKSLISINDRAGYNLWETNLTTGAGQPITDFKTDKIYRFDASPDGRFYAFARGDYFHDAILIER